MGGAGRTLDDFGKSAGHAEGGVGRLNNAFASMATQVAGVNPVLGKAVEIIGSLAAPGMVVTGAVAGLALVAFAWDQLTKSAREASKAQDEAIKRTAQMARMKGAGPGGQTSLDVGVLTGKLEVLRQKRTAMASDIASHPILAAALDQTDTLQALDDDIENVSNLLILARKWNQEAITGAQGHAAAIKEVIGKVNELRDAAEKVNAENLKTNKDWWRSYIEKTGEALTLTEELRRAQNAALPTLVESFGAGLSMSQIPEFQMPKIQMPFEGLTDAQKETAAKLGILVDKQDSNTSTIANAVLSGAGIIVNALNIGGGGRGSGIGGALGSVAGTAVGTMIGRSLGSGFGSLIAPGVGTIVGSLLGSALGGLFDSNKRAVNANTQATRENTAALLINAPAGFRVSNYSYGAQSVGNADVDAYATAVRRRQSRGGASPL